MVTLTKVSKQEIQKGMTPKGGFTRKTLTGWGVSWPPPKGWRKALVSGTPQPDPVSPNRPTATEEQLDAFG